MKAATAIWLHGLTCNGNTQSLLCAPEALLDTLLRRVNFLFHPSFCVEDSPCKAIEEVLSAKQRLNILVLEGAVGEDNMYRLKGRSFKEVIKELARAADYVVAVGNCAVHGNIPALKDDVSGLQFKFKEPGGILGEDFRSRKGLPVINISGCPAHPEWIAMTLIALAENRIPQLDKWNRPKHLYAYFVHDGCLRVQYYEWKVEAKELGKKEGCLFYHFGCRGPLTKASCNKILWNSVSSKTRSGQPCFGCTEFDFPRRNMWETKYNMGIPAQLPPGVSLRGYIMLSGVAKTFTPSRLKKNLLEE